MIVSIIVAAEVGFWVVLLAGLAVRYLLRMPKASSVILALVHVVNIVLVVATAIDLRNGARAGWAHGLAAVYLGSTLAFGHSIVHWVDVRFAHRFAGGPPPQKPPKYGTARTLREWKTSGQTILGCAISAAALYIMILWIDDPSRSDALWGWLQRMGVISGVAFIWAMTYTLWPKEAPKQEAEQESVSKSLG